MDDAFEYRYGTTRDANIVLHAYSLTAIESYTGEEVCLFLVYQMATS